MPTKHKVVRNRVKELRLVKASELIANQKNWRTHPANQRQAMLEILNDVGYVDAIKVRETPNGLEIIDGHLRAETTPDTIVPVLVLDVSEGEADKVLATFDPISALAGRDQDKLDALLESVKFDSDGLNKLLAELSGVTPPVKHDPGADIDKAEELLIKWKTERGQLWTIGKHRLMCGDACSAIDISKLMNGEHPFLCVTDPPYGVNYDPGWRSEAADKGLLSYAARRIGEVTNDDRSDWSEAWKLTPCDVIYSWHPPGATSLVHAKALQDSGFDLRMQIIWAKSNFPIGRGDYHVRHEPCWYAVRHGKPARRNDDRTQTTLWEINLDKNVEGGHSTQKPLECMARAIRNHECEDVYDPFIGSGTTMVAAEQLKRVCYGMEIEPKYVAVTLERMSKMGLKPRLSNE